MTDFEIELRKRVHDRGFSLAEDIKAINAQLAEMHESAALWILRGDLIQLCNDCENISLDEALNSYQATIQCEPTNPKGYEEIAFYLDNIEDKPQEAELYFRKAIALGAGKSAYDGLTQILKQLNKLE